MLIQKSRYVCESSAKFDVFDHIMISCNQLKNSVFSNVQPLNQEDNYLNVYNIKTLEIN